MGKPTLSPRILCLASTGTCQGKTVLATGLAKSLSSLGLSVACFIIGPQSLNGPASARETPVLLEAASGHEVQCVDPWLLGGSDKLLGYLSKHCKAAQADVALLVGMRGLYDPAPGLEHESGCTTAQIAKDLKASCILVLDGCCSVGSALALLKGHLELDRQLHVPCVLLNRADNSSGLNAASMQAAVRSAGLDTRVLGCMPKASWSATATPEERTASLASLVTRHVDLEGLLAACPPVELRPSHTNHHTNHHNHHVEGTGSGASNPHQSHHHTNLTHSLSALVRRAAGSVGSGGGAQPPPTTTPSNNHASGLGGAGGGGPGVRVSIAVAVDEVFGCSFPGNLGALEVAGAQLVRFSPLHDVRLPEGVSGVYLGGPATALATHGGLLSLNAPMRAALSAFASAGGVILAEAAGLAYLSQALSAPAPPSSSASATSSPAQYRHQSQSQNQQQAWPMVGVFPFRAHLLPQERGPEEGYVELDVLPAAAHLLSFAPPPSPNSGSASPFHAVPGGGVVSAGGSGCGTPRAHGLSTPGGVLNGGGGGQQPFPSGASFSGQQYGGSLPSLRAYLHSCVELVEEVRHSMGGRMGSLNTAHQHQQHNGGGALNHPTHQNGSGAADDYHHYAPAFRACAPAVPGSQTHSLPGGLVGQGSHVVPAGGGGSTAGSHHIGGNGQYAYGHGSSTGSTAGHHAARSAPAAWLTGYVKGGVLASALHLPLAVCPEVTAAWVAACGRMDAFAAGKAATAAAAAATAPAFSMHHALMQHGLGDEGSPTPPMGPMAHGSSWTGNGKGAGSVSPAPPPFVPLSRSTSSQGLPMSRPHASAHANGNGNGVVGGLSLAGFDSGKHHKSTHQLSGMAGSDSGAALYLPPSGQGVVQPLQRSPPSHKSDMDLSRHLAAAGGTFGSSTGGTFGSGTGRTSRASADFPMSVTGILASHASPRGLQPHSYGSMHGLGANGPLLAGTTAHQQGCVGGGHGSTGAVNGVGSSGGANGGTNGSSANISFAEGVRRRLALSARSSIDDLLSLVPQPHVTSHLAGREGASGSGALNLGGVLPLGSVGEGGARGPGMGSSATQGHHRRMGSQQFGVGLAWVDEDDANGGAGGGTRGAGGGGGQWSGEDVFLPLGGLVGEEGMRMVPGGLPPLYGRTHNKMIGLACPLRPPNAGAGAGAGAGAAVGAQQAAALKGSAGAAATAPLDGCGSASCHGCKLCRGSAARAGGGGGEVVCGGSGSATVTAAPSSTTGLLSRSSSSKSMQHMLHGPGSATSMQMPPSSLHATLNSALHGTALLLRNPDPVAHSDAIVSMCPGATEALVAMGLGGRLVGVSEGCDWPPEIPGTKALAVRSRVPLVAGTTASGALVRPGTREWAAAAGQLAAEGVSQILVDEDLLREECPGLVVLPALEGLGRPEVLALQRALQRTVLSTSGRGGGGGVGGGAMMGGGAAGGDAPQRCVVLQHACRTLSDVLDSILQLGDAAAAPQAAGVLTDRLRARLRRAAAAAATALHTTTPIAPVPAHAPSSAQQPSVSHPTASSTPPPTAAAGGGWRPRMLVLSSLTPGAMVRAGKWVPELIALSGSVQAAPPVPTTAAVGSGAGGAGWSASSSGASAPTTPSHSHLGHGQQHGMMNGGSADGRKSLWVPAVAYPPASAPVPPAPSHASHQLEAGDADVPMSWEELRASAPDVIVVAGVGGSELAAAAAAAELPGWWSLPAVHAGQVYVVEGGCLLRPGPRLVDGAELLTRITLCTAGHYVASLSGSAPGGGGMGGGGMGTGGVGGGVGERGEGGVLALPRPPPGSVLKLSLSGGQRCRPRLLPNYIIPWQ